MTDNMEVTATFDSLSTTTEAAFDFGTAGSVVETDYVQVTESTSICTIAIWFINISWDLNSHK